MSKAVLMSIQPKWCELIANGKKTVEVRKTKPKLSTPFKVYIYCTKDMGGNLRGCYPDGTYHWLGKVIGEFVCDSIDEIRVVDSDLMRYVTFNDKADMFITEEARLSVDELYDYLWPKKGFVWHISDLVIYDKPKELSEFTGLRKTKFGYEPVKMQRPPQSWCYVEELE